MEQINTRLLVFKNDLQCMIVASDLPPVVIGLVLDNVRAQVTIMETAAIAKENETQEDQVSVYQNRNEKSFRYDGERLQVTEKEGE